jgi:hypothetical protein
MSDTSDAQLPLRDDLEARQKELWRWAAKRVVPWGKLQKDDCNFRHWVKDEKTESIELLRASCLYEYARESHKLRCLLVFDSKQKPKELLGTVTVVEFKGSSAGYIHLLDSGWGRWLSNFADELIANKSFAEVLRTDLAKVQQSLNALPSYSLFPKAVRAVQSAGQYSNYPGSQIVEIQICWRYYNDDEIGEEMKELAEKLRPAEWKGPHRRGRGKATSMVALLDALSAMRLRSHHLKRGTANAIDEFDDVRLGKIGGVPIHSDLDEYAGRAQRQFARWFPFGEAPANGITWSQRQRRKQ